jgi:DNA-binding NarL/FixJ family response regulator
MPKIFLASTDKIFFEKFKKIVSDTSNLTFGNTESEQDKVNEALGGKADLVVLDFHDIHFLRDTFPKAPVIITSDTYDLKKEYLSARFGAKGFITKDLDTQSCIRAIDVVNSGNIWMTRSVATMILREYSNLLRM